MGPSRPRDNPFLTSGLRSLDAVVTAQKAQIGIFLTLEEPTKTMTDYARSAGLFPIPGTTLQAPRIQVVTVREALEKGLSAVNLPLRHASPYRSAPKEPTKPATGDLFS